MVNELNILPWIGTIKLVKRKRVAADTLNPDTLFILKFQGTKDVIVTLVCTKMAAQDIVDLSYIGRTIPVAGLAKIQ